MPRQMFRERECIHRDEGAEGDFYNGVFYVQALQRLRVDDAVKVAGKLILSRMLIVAALYPSYPIFPFPNELCETKYSTECVGST